MNAGWSGEGRHTAEAVSQRDQRMPGLAGPPAFDLEESGREGDRHYGAVEPLSPRSRPRNRSWRDTTGTLSAHEASRWTGTSGQLLYHPGSPIASTSASAYPLHQPGSWGSVPERNEASGLRLPPIFVQSRQGSPGQPGYLGLAPHAVVGGNHEGWSLPKRNPPPTSMGFGLEMYNDGSEAAGARELETVGGMGIIEYGSPNAHEPILKRK